jgi:hypothetical protein
MTDEVPLSWAILVLTVPLALVAVIVLIVERFAA